MVKTSVIVGLGNGGFIVFGNAEEEVIGEDCDDVGRRRAAVDVSIPDERRRYG